MKMKTLMAISAFIIFFSASFFPITDGLPTSRKLDLLALASKAVSEVLKAAPRQSSSIILITDGSISSEAVLKVIGDLRSSWGTTVFEIPPGIEDVNKTRDHLSTVIANARRVRKASLAVTLLVLTEEDEFLTTFADVCDDGRLLVWSTRLLLVTSLERERLNQLMERYWVFSMMNTMVMILDYDSRDSRLRKADVLAHLPYRPNRNIIHVAQWTPKRGLQLSSLYQMFPEKYSNFYGSYMNVTFWPFMPYFMSMEEVTGDPDLAETYTGRDYIMLETMASILNFTINILPVESWDETLLKVAQRVSFMSPMMMSILPHLLEVMDFSIAYEPEKQTFAMKKPKLKPRWENLYYPLNYMVWSLILASLGLMPFVLYAADRLRPNNRLKPGLSPWLAVQESFGTFFGQSLSRNLLESDSLRILMASWFIFSYILCSFYRANLTAFLMLPKYPPRIETLKEFIKAETIMLTPPDAVDFYNEFKKSPPGDLRTLSERMIFVPDIKIGFHRVLRENVGYLYERRNMELNIARYYTSKDNNWTPLYVAKDSIWPGSSAWPIIKDAPFKPVVDRYIRQFVETGLLYKWDLDMNDLFKRATRESRRKKELEGAQKRDETLPGIREISDDIKEESATSSEFDVGSGEDERGGIKPLSIVHLQGPLLLLLIILSFSVLVFAVEVFMGDELRICKK